MALRTISISEDPIEKARKEQRRHIRVSPTSGPYFAGKGASNKLAEEVLKVSNKKELMAFQDLAEKARDAGQISTKEKNSLLMRAFKNTESGRKYARKQKLYRDFGKQAKKEGKPISELKKAKKGLGIGDDVELKEGGSNWRIVERSPDGKRFAVKQGHTGKTKGITLDDIAGLKTGLRQRAEEGKLTKEDKGKIQQWLRTKDGQTRIVTRRKSRG